MGKTVESMRYEIETNCKDCLLAQALRDEMAKKWEESLEMANATNVDRSRFIVYWAEEIDQLADFQLQVIRQYQSRWRTGMTMYGTWQ